MFSYVAGKEARKTGAGAFIKAASLEYQGLNEEERARLIGRNGEQVTKQLTARECAPGFSRKSKSR